MRFVTINTFITVFDEITWDIHGSKPFTSIEGMRDLICPMYDQGYTALLEDLHQRGMLVAPQDAVRELRRRLGERIDAAQTVKIAEKEGKIALVRQHAFLCSSAGVQVIRDEVTAINIDKKRVVLKRVEDLPYDRLVVAPGIDFMFNEVAGLDAKAQETILHAWKAGPQTVALRKQLADFMRIDLAARALKAIAHPLRLKIMCVVGDQEVCVQEIVDAARAKLLSVRNRRVWPGRDDKVLTAWNGLMIAAIFAAAISSAASRRIARSVSSRRAATRLMRTSSGSLSTLKHLMPTSSASFISASVLPRPENTTLRPRPRLRWARRTNMAF